MVILLACTDAPAEGVDPPDGSHAVDTAPGADSPTETGHSAETGETGPTPVDADGDGHASLASGGDDCDDEDAWIHPDAFEYCDGVDQDCDGSTLADCGEVQPWAEPFAFSIWYAGGWGVPISDVTGDGLGDLWLGAASDVALLAGRAFDPADPPAEVGAYGWYGGGYDFHQHLFDAGDLDGDGADDLVIAEGYRYQRFFIAWGPIAEDGGTSWVEDGSLSEWWPVEGELETWGSPAWTAGDLDGDGCSDLVAEREVQGESGTVWLDFYYGSATREPRVESIRTDLDVSAKHHVTPTGDLDGDGVSDLIAVHSGDSPFWLSGADLVGAAGAALDDVVAGAFDAEATETTFGALAWYNVGDWDGDGLPDVVGADSSYSDDPDLYGGLMYYYGRVTTGTVLHDGLVGDNISLSSFCDGGFPWPGRDGVAAGFACATGADYYYYGSDDLLLVFPPEPIVGTWDADELQHLTLSRVFTDGSGFEALRAGPDVTGDGIGDIIANADAAVILLPGFEIPWDDPDWW